MSRVLYEAQRAMRARREAALKRGMVAVLDVGSSKVACLVLKFDPDPQRQNRFDGVGNLAGHADFKVAGTATTRSRGVEFGEIAAMEETEAAVRTAVQAAQKMAGARLDHVIVCFSGGRPRSYGVTGEIELSDEEVREVDVGHVLAACDIPDYGDGREALHALPVNFTLDGRTGLKDPRGQVGRRLSVDMHLLTAAAGPIQNILTCIRRCDLELSGLVVSSYASGLAALVEDEQELGAACIDMGAGSTGVSIFLKRHMIYADAVRIGGMHVTQDITHGLHIPLPVAERIKTFHGGLIATGMDDRDMIEVPGFNGDVDTERRQVSRSELIGVMRPRVEEILEDARDRLDAAGFEHLPSQRIVLTGGGSQIPGLEELASRILGRQVRMGKPLRVQGLPPAATGPAFSSAVGLALHAVHPQDECWDFEMPVDQVGGRSLRRAVRWFRENW